MGKLKHQVRYVSIFLLAIITCLPASSQHSIARKWNEVILEGVRNSFARPTIHARNLFHLSGAMYDSWAIYDDEASTYFLNSDRVNCPCQVPGVSNIDSARTEMMSYAIFRLIYYRFRGSPGFAETKKIADSLFLSYGYDPDFKDTDFSEGSAAALGNYLADCVIEYGLSDGSNEPGNYQNQYYQPVNPEMDPLRAGTQGLEDPNRWQPLAFGRFIDQSGHESEGVVTEFLSPEWGDTRTFAMFPPTLVTYQRDDHNYRVYHDPGGPPQLDKDDPESSELYKWGFSLVSIWQSHHDPSDGVMWDISPASIGNITELPDGPDDYPGFYNLEQGGDNSPGWDLNPITDEPYEPQLIPRGDYSRVLAEFWADGPDSETPPGHWYVILNYVSDHPDLVKQYEGQGEIMDNLEWDVKAYFTLGGAMHDAAVTAWSIKGWYDYIRPISAIRFMSEQGQSTDKDLPKFDKLGFNLKEGYIEQVEKGDPLAAPDNLNVKKIKLYTWRGPNYIEDPATTAAGVGWILAENWWPYQRPTFVTPPFAGYISGHSTFSRAAAEVLSAFTGSRFFPGGMGEFHAPKNEFLVFEEGPSVDVTLQWATYQDASDQCSLSRIWGGIHPPADDIPGRKIGIVVGNEAFAMAKKYFNGEIENILSVNEDRLLVYPNPATVGEQLNIKLTEGVDFVDLQLFDLNGSLLFGEKLQAKKGVVNISLPDLRSGIYVLRYSINNLIESQLLQVQRN